MRHISLRSDRDISAFLTHVTHLHRVHSYNMCVSKPAENIHRPIRRQHLLQVQSVIKAMPCLLLPFGLLLSRWGSPYPGLMRTLLPRGGKGILET